MLQAQLRLSHVERVLRALYGFGASHADAQDLAQDVLLLALRKQEAFDAERGLDGWLYGLARNVYRDFRKSARVRREVVDEVSDAMMDSAAANAPTEEASMETQLTMRAAMAALPEELQDLVVLHVLEEHTLKETAGMLGIPFDTAKDRFKRARLQLRVALGEWPDAVAATGADDDAMTPNPALLTAAAALRRHHQAAARVAAGAVLAGVLAKWGAGAAAAATVASTAASPMAVGASSAWTITIAGKAKLLVLGTTALLAMGGTATVGYIAGRNAESKPAVVAASTPAAAAAIPPAPTLPATSPPIVAPLPHALSRAPTPPATAPAKPTVENPESLAIDQARTALRRGLTHEAIVGLMSHARKYPAGQLAAERDILLIEAYRAQGDEPKAQRLIHAFLERHPNSPLRKRISSTAPSP